MIRNIDFLELMYIYPVNPQSNEAIFIGPFDVYTTSTYTI